MKKTQVNKIKKVINLMGKENVKKEYKENEFAFITDLSYMSKIQVRDINKQELKNIIAAL